MSLVRLSRFVRLCKLPAHNEACSVSPVLVPAPGVSDHLLHVGPAKF